MSSLSINTLVQDITTGANMGVPFSWLTGGRGVYREKKMVSSTETSFTLSVSEPGYVCIRNFGFDATPTDPDAVVQWGTATGVLPFEINPGHTQVVKIKAGGGVTGIFVVTSAVTSDQWIEVSCWSES